MTPPVHLSRVHLRHPISSTQVLHALAAELAAGPEGRVLWALPLARLLVVQGPRPGAVTSRCARQVADITTTARDCSWRHGQPVVLSLIACPTSMDGATRKRRTVPDGDLDGWLTRKLVDAVEMGEVRHQVLGLRTGQRAGGRVAHRWVAFDGVGRVTDPAALGRHVLAGVGSGKAYGGGLLLTGESS